MRGHGQSANKSCRHCGRITPPQPSCRYCQGALCSRPCLIAHTPRCMGDDAYRPARANTPDGSTDRPPRGLCSHCKGFMGVGQTRIHCTLCNAVTHHNCHRPHYELMHPGEEVPDGFRTEPVLSGLRPSSAMAVWPGNPRESAGAGPDCADCSSRAGKHRRPPSLEDGPRPRTACD